MLEWLGLIVRDAQVIEVAAIALGGALALDVLDACLRGEKWLGLPVHEGLARACDWISALVRTTLRSP